MSSHTYFTEEQQQIAKIAQALSSPVRVAILQLLSTRNCCYHGDMAEELPVARSTLSQHLNVLKEAGLIKDNIQPPKTKYYIHRDNYQKSLGLFQNFFHKTSDPDFNPEEAIICADEKE